MELYTHPKVEYPYTGNYPIIFCELLGNREKSVEVGVGLGNISLDGKPLISEGFGSCSALIIRNRSNLETAMFHIWSPSRFYFEQTPLINELMRRYLNSLSLEPSERESLILSMGFFTECKNPERHKLLQKEALKSRMRQLNREGTIQARFIFGDGSINVRPTIQGGLLDLVGIDVVEDIRINTDSYGWGILYVPQESMVFVRNGKSDKVMGYYF